MTDTSTGGLYYDIEGRPINSAEYSNLLMAKNIARSNAPSGQSTPVDDPTRIGSDHVGSSWISTTWLGLDHNFGAGPPLIFETMIFGGDYDEHCWRWATREAALAGHEGIVAALRSGDNPDQEGQ